MIVYVKHHLSEQCTHLLLYRHTYKHLQLDGCVCMQGLERQLELHPSVPPPFTPVPVPAPAPLPILQARDVTVEPQERREYIEHDGQLQHMDNIDQRSYAEAVGQNPVTVQQVRTRPVTRTVENRRRPCMRDWMPLLLP